MVTMSRRALVVAAGGVAGSAAVAGAVARWPGPSAPVPEVLATTFGTVALLGSTRHVLAARGAAHGHATTEGGRPAESIRPSAVHGAWTEAVVVDVAVRNDLRSPMELTAGQFRVRVDDDGPTVSLYAADRPPGPLAGGSGARMRITYLAPPPEHGLTLEFADTDAPEPLRLGALARAATAGADR